MSYVARSDPCIDATPHPSQPVRGSPVWRIGCRTGNKPLRDLPDSPVGRRAGREKSCVYRPPCLRERQLQRASYSLRRRSDCSQVAVQSGMLWRRPEQPAKISALHRRTSYPEAEAPASVVELRSDEGCRAFQDGIWLAPLKRPILCRNRASLDRVLLAQRQEQDSCA